MAETGQKATGETILRRLRNVHIFSKLDDDELIQVAHLCKVWRVSAEHIIFNEGDEGNQLFVIHEGSVRVSLTTRTADGKFSRGTINTLHAGQSFGELVLLYSANRTATVTSAGASVLLVLNATDFLRLCESNPRIGYRVMQQIAADLAYKLHSSNLLLHGTIRWQQDELGPRKD
jgi:CRP-like cAMP-binding protein